jgi:hypothetical protein
MDDIQRHAEAGEAGDVIAASIITKANVRIRPPQVLVVLAHCSCLCLPGFD